MLFKSKLIVILSFFLSIYQVNLYAQNKVVVTLKGLKSGDTALLRIQKSGEEFKFKYVGGTGSDIIHTFDTLSNGKWALSVDAKTYIFPTAAIIQLNNNSFESTVQLTKAPVDSNFNYQWQDDSSFVGHAQQAYINDKVEIVVLGKAEKVPDDFNSINALNEYGFLFSDEESKWTSEESYRLYQTLKKFNFPRFGETSLVRVKAKWILTDKFIDRDIDFKTVSGVDVITISRAAFTYATPQVVTVDGVKGKFFSKRLFTSLVYYYTDKGTNKDKIAEIAKTRYGFEFLLPSVFLKNLMGETETNFQEFTSDEKIIILSMFEEFPDAMQRQAELKYMVRRVNGQPHPVYPDAPAIAWVTNNNIEWMEGAFKSQDITYMQRLVLHEKAHFLWEHTFDKTTQDDWATLGGWSKDPASGSGWSTNNTTEFVSAYAHLKNPNEDMAESIAFFITNPEAFRSRSLKKFEFVRDRIMKGTRYISVIRPDLTFQVYNLFPDYNYPGKIKRTKLEVVGAPNEDKIVKLEIELTIMNKAFDGADWASCRFISSIGTIKDMFLRPVNSQKSILRGEMSLSKFAKSGYWIIPQMVIGDLQGNMRLENNSTYGVKCFVNNPLEDVTAPLYVQKSLKLDSIQDKFIDLSGYPAIDRCGTCADTLKPSTALRLSYDFIEKNKINPDGRAYATIYFPTLDSTDKNNISPYSKGVQINGTGIKNDFTDSLKKAVFYFPIPEYFPSGYYTVSHIAMTDQALNVRNVLFDLDLNNREEFLNPPINTIQRALRDSFYFKTKYPDYKPPVLDINDIQIRATPTNPTSPNGETLFEMWLWIKDTSDYPGRASGFRDGFFRLRDPQGLEHTYDIKGNGSTFANIYSDSSIYGYKRYYTKILLPAGSPPGIWGVSSITINDQAYNKKYYSFVEYVRFDVEQSKVLQVTPFVEILGKRVNSKNVDSVAVKIGCKSCIDQNYRIRMYSSMGGSSVVSEGKMTKDTITVSNLNLKGVNDGVLFATVFMLDSTRALIGTGRATYTKDATLPTNYNLTPNRSLLGRSNLDSFIVAIKSVEISSSNLIILRQISINPGSTGQIGDSVVINSIRDIYTANLPVVNSTAQNRTGNQFNLESEGGMPSALMNTGFYDSTLRIPKSVFDKLADGTIEIKLISTDSVGNNGLSVSQFIYKDTKAPTLSIVNDSLVGLKKYVKLVSDEFISNTPTVSDFVVSNGVINSITKLNSKTFGLVITKSCNNNLNIQLNGSVLQDSVGNSNTTVTSSFNDNIVPATPIVSASTVTTFCEGGTVSLTSNATSVNQWFKDGQIISGSVGTQYVASASGSYTVISTNSNGCTSPVSSGVVVTVNPKPSAPVTAASAVCEGEAVNALTATASTGNSLRWYGTSATGGTASTTAPTPSSSAVGVTNFYVSQITAQGCESERSVLAYTVHPKPFAPVTAASSVCEGGVVSAITATASTGNSLRWYGTSATGGTASTTAPTPSSSSAGITNFYVSQITAQGCESERSVLAYTVHPKPSAPVTIASAVCEGGVVSALTATASTGNSLRWYGTSATGGTASTSAPTVSSSVVGVTNYYVSQVSAQGCESGRSILVHTVNPLPAKPVISWSGVQFSTTATGVNYQWLLNGALVAGATASTHKPLNTGDFRLRITDPNGCINISDSFKLVVTALANLVTTPSSNIATVYPNPASNKVVLEFATLPTINLNFQLVSPSGKVLSSTTGRNKVNIIDVSDIQSGNYFIRVIGKRYDQVKKVLIQK